MSTDWSLGYDLTDRSAVGIAAAITRRIGAGELGVGDRLPTVRTIARELRVSAATVSQAWQALAASGVIVSRGRAGTFVAEGAVRQPMPSSRYWRVHPADGPAFGLDLSRGTPDPALLPAIRPALQRLSDAALDSDYLGETTIPELEELLRASFPVPAERMVVLDGAMDAVDRVVRERVRFGDRVLMEDPGFPPFLDLLSRAGAQVVPVAVDTHGPVVAEVAAGLELDPTMLVLQPRAHNPTGASMTVRRSGELADLLSASSVLVVEDDHSGPVASAPDVTLAGRLPDHVVHIRSYSKSHGADLRLSMVAGPAAVLDPVVDGRMLGPGWTSRLLQRLLLLMLTDRRAVSAVDRARLTYARRAQALRIALADNGIDIAPADGINVWVPVRDEAAALVSLAAAGITAAPGTPFRVDDVDAQHLRITIACLREDDAARVGAELAAAAGAEPLYPRRRG
ncbi:aminotransferase-like domain-containing protein [Williamsia sterculiae]|nr:PLP-dependent aminotransferase family protein [Williamsia sterculiae]